MTTAPHTVSESFIDLLDADMLGCVERGEPTMFAMLFTKRNHLPYTDAGMERLKGLCGELRERLGYPLKEYA